MANNKKVHYKSPYDELLEILTEEAGATVASFVFNRWSEPARQAFFAVNIVTVLREHPNRQEILDKFREKYPELDFERADEIERYFSQFKEDVVQ